MSVTINANLASTNASLNLKRASSRLSKSIQRLSSGKRITTSSDDAGGLAVAMKLQSSLRRATASMMNTQNGISFLQMQDSVLKIAGEIVDRMSELKSFYNDVSKNDTDRETYNHEFHELQKELGSLKRQKFNGVSLFASVQQDNNNLKIRTSDDGLEEPIEVSRTGLFENFKSKYGADGKLDSGSHGEYRQLVGDFSRDGGYLDATPGRTTKDYKAGDVVFRDGDGGGYFMALNDVATGSMIEDTGNDVDRGIHSQWIRIANLDGKGFSEAYPNAPLYDHNNLKFNAEGTAVSYLKGDILKVQAHWNDPNSFIFIEAQSDVPRNITLDRIMEEYIGENRYFNYVGQTTSYDEGRPTSSYIMPNSEHVTPIEYTNSSLSEFRSLLKDAGGNNYTPSFVQVGEDIYQPSHDWGIKEWTDSAIFKYGDIVVSLGTDASPSTDMLFELTPKVKGSYLGGVYSEGDFVLAGGNWYVALQNIEPGKNPASPENAALWEEVLGSPLSADGFANDVTTDYANVTAENSEYWAKTHFGTLEGKTINVDYKRGDNIYYQGKHYIYTSHLNSSDQVFTSGSGQGGITEFEQLVLQGAVTELDVYIDKVGAGGSADLDHGVYYKPNQALEFIDRLPNTGLVRTNSIERRTDPNLAADGVFNTEDDIFYEGLNPGSDGIYGTPDDYYSTTAFIDVAKRGGHVDADADNNKDLLSTSNDLGDFSVADFVDYIQTIANFRAITGGTLTRLDYASRMLEENQLNLETAHSRLMDTDIARESSRMAQQSVLMQASAAMITQANQMNQVVLQLLQ
jgi:flagellin-like hook-associated protein FlgL